MSYLMDTGFWYASIDSSDEHHSSVKLAAERMREPVIVPVPVITETAYLIQKRRGIEQLAAFVESLAASHIILENPIADDYTRTAEILRKYNDVNLDFVDACVVAIAERLNITKILTVDRRHFSIFRPSHCDAFELLP